MSALRVFFFPDYRQTNPYQALLYAALPEDARALPGTVFEVLDYLEMSKSKERVVFHLHWTAPILGPARNTKEAEWIKRTFVNNLERLKKRGCGIVWTIHNVLPHDNRFPETEVDLRRQIAAIADRIHIHSEHSVNQITAVYELPAERVCVLPHGNYIRVYPNYVTRALARKRFQYLEHDVVFLFLGQLRPYKGIDELFSAFSRLHDLDERAKLMVAGKPVHPYRPGMIRSSANILRGVSVVEGHIPDDQLQWYFNAADIAVLPYRSILTSGSVLNAMSFGLPVIAPDVGMLNELVHEAETGYRFQGGNADGLFRKMEAFLRLDQKRRQEMGQKALSVVEPYTWDRLGSALFSGIGREPENWRVANGGKEVSIQIESGTYRCEVVDRLDDHCGPGRVAIILLNYEHLEDTVRAVASLEASSYRAFDIVVVDNNSPEITIDLLNKRLGDCTLIRSPVNLGYAGGNNLAIEYIKEKPFEFIWVLNPDTVVEADTLGGFVNAASEHSQSNIFGAVITHYSDPGTVWFGGGSVDLSNGLRTSHMYSGVDVALVPDDPYTVDYITGASLFVRKDVFSRIGLFPEHYFLYFEETDWCLNARAHGEQLLVVPSVRLAHAKRSEQRNIPTKTYFYYYIRNFLLFAARFNSEQRFLARRHLEQDFIGRWQRLIGERSPQEEEFYRALAERALDDGCKGVSGRVDLLNLFSVDDIPEDVPCFRGFLDNANEQTINGWVVNLRQPLERLEVAIFIDDDRYQQVSAREYRGDIKKAGIGDGFYGFSITPPGFLFDSQPHRVRAVVCGAGFELSGSPKTVTLAARKARFVGKLERIADQYVQGWACDEGDLDAEVEVEILRDGRVISSALANQHRPDLKRMRVPHWQKGFRAPFPVALNHLGKHHELTLRVRGNNQVLHSEKLKVQPPKGLRQAPPSPTDLLRAMYHHRELLPALPGNTDSPALEYLETLQGLLKAQYRDSPQTVLVSVIMPAYNRAQTIAASISSVIDQSYRNWELLVIDDGSRDATGEVVRELIETTGETRIRLIRLAENSGVSHARNAGMMHAKGEIFAYLDSDNLWLPDYLLILVNTMLDSGWARSVYCGQESYRVISGETSETELYSIRLGGFNRALLENRNYIDLNVFVHRRELYERLGGFREDMSRLVDWELILRYTADQPPAFVPLVLNHYFIGKTDNQITAVVDFDDNFKRVQESIEGSDSFLYRDHCSAGRDNESQTISAARQVLIAMLPVQDQYALALALNAVIANTCLAQATVIVHLEEQRHDLIEWFNRNYGQIEGFELATVESGSSYLDVLGQAMKRAECDFVLLAPEAVPGHGWLRALQRAVASDPTIAAVVSREIRPGIEAERIGIPYITRALKADVAVKPDQLLNERFCESRSLAEIREFSLFCTYFPSDMCATLTHFGHHERQHGEWTTRLSMIIRELLGRHIVYTPDAKVFHVNCFQ